MEDVIRHILEVDGQYGPHRQMRGVPNVVYMRRRAQLFRRPTIVEVERRIEIRQEYLGVREALLAERYGAMPPRQDLQSVRSSMDETRSFLSLQSSGKISAHRRTMSAIPTLGTPRGSKAGAEDAMSRLSIPGRGHPSSLSHEPGGRRARSASAGDKNPPSANAAPAPHAHSVVPRARSPTALADFYQFKGMQCVFDHNRKSVTRVLFANDDIDLVAWACEDGTVTVARVRYRPTVLHILEGHQGSVTDFAWAVTNDMLTTVSVDRTFRVWQLHTGDPLKIVDTGRKLQSCALCPLNNNFLAVGAENARVYVYNVSLGKPTKNGKGSASGAVNTLVFETSGRLLWSGDSKGVVHSFQFDAMTGALTGLIRVIVCDARPVTSLSFAQWATRDTKEPCLLMNCKNDTVYLLRVADSRGVVKQKRTYGLKQSTLRIRSAFCPQTLEDSGACIVSGSEDGKVHIFNTSVGRKAGADHVSVRELKGHPAGVTAVAWNADCSLLASSDAGGTVIFWKRGAMGDKSTEADKKS